MAKLTIETYRGAHIDLAQEPGETTCTGYVRYTAVGTSRRVHLPIRDGQNITFISPDDVVAVGRAMIDGLVTEGKLVPPVCPACFALEGKSSDCAPHLGLRASGVGAFGTPLGTMEKTDERWHCSDCGSWMYRDTPHGETPERWRRGERPHDWPATEV